MADPEVIKSAGEMSLPPVIAMEMRGEGGSREETWGAAE